MLGKGKRFEEKRKRIGIQWKEGIKNAECGVVIAKLGIGDGIIKCSVKGENIKLEKKRNGFGYGFLF